MRSSNSIIKAEVFTREVLQFEPTRLSTKDPELVSEKMTAGAAQSHFKVAEVMKNFTGLATLESDRLEKHIEEKTLEKLQEIQERAYAEAYKLGEDEGKAEAIKKNEEEILHRLSELDNLITSIKELKPQLVNFNEAHLIKLIYFLSTKLAMFEIQSHDDAILHVLKETIKLTQADEKITVNVSEKDYQYIENFKKDLKREFEFIKKIEFIPHESVQTGGCVIMTNYGEIDATIEARTEQMWKSIEESLPKSKDQIGI